MEMKYPKPKFNQKCPNCGGPMLENNNFCSHNCYLEYNKGEVDKIEENNSISSKKRSVS